MSVFVLQKYPDGRTLFTRSFTDRVPALEYIRKQLSYKSLMASASTYTIHSWEDCESYKEGYNDGAR